MADPRAALYAAARAHHGVVTTSLARELGLTRAQLRTDLERGRWRRSAGGVLVSTSSPANWLQGVAVATTATGGVASHRTAARLHGFDGHHDEIVEVTVLRGVGRTAGEWRIHQTSVLPPGDVVSVEGIRTTGLARTVVDLGAVVPEELVEQALDDLGRRGMSERWVEQTLTRVDRPGPTGTAVLRRLLEREDRQGPLPDSMFERLIERAAVDAGLPAPERQVRVTDGAGELVAVLDAAWPDRRVGSEAQSERWHGGPRGAARDMDRHNVLTALGWRMLYATWSDARSPERLVHRLRAAYDGAADRPTS